MDPPAAAAPPPWEAAPPSSAGPSTLPASPARPDPAVAMPPPPTSWEGSAASSANPSPVGPPRLKVKLPLAPSSSQATPTGGRGVPRRGRGRGGGGAGGGRTSTRLSSMAEQAGRIKTVKLSLKASRGGGEAVGKTSTSFLGDYDRELDEDMEPLHFEEQFILRVPREVAEGKGEGTGTGLREMIKGKGKGLDGIEFKFLDSRRAVFKINGVTYSSKLVDLPNIIESQKTFDSRHLFKVADISQMLVVDKPIPHESAMPPSANAEEYIWPHGLTPPLRHVRKRRFRKRISRRAIEVVEEQVEELLKKDGEAEESVFEMLDAHPDPDVPDSYYVDYDPERAWRHANRGDSVFAESETYEDPGSVQAGESPWPDGDGEGEWDGEGGEDDGEGEEDEGDGLDEELAAALMEQMEARSDEGSGSEDGLYGSDDEDDEGDGGGSEEEDDEETTEKKAKIKQFNSEIKALETAIEKKRAGFTGGNAIMMKRFEETIAGMQADISTKAASRQALIDDIERSKPAAAVVPPPRKDGKGEKGRGRDGDGDMDMEDPDADAEGEEEDDEGTGTGTGTGTPALREGESPAYYEQGEEEDLFGDASTEDGTPAETPAETPAAGYTPGPTRAAGDADVEAMGADDAEDHGDGDADGDEEEEGGGEGGEEGDGDEVDEMAALLRAEISGPDDAAAGAEGGDEEIGEDDLQNMAALLPDTMSSPAMGTPGENVMDEDTFNALDGIAATMSSPAPYNYGAVEGGVGMRRLAEGVTAEDDDDEASSDDSD